MERVCPALVRDARGRALGWYAYYLEPGEISQVLQVGLLEEDDSGAVLDHLFHHAQQNGSAALRGRVEPRLLEPLAGRWCIFRYGGEALVHSKRPVVLAAISSRKAMLTKLEGEWWMEHHL